MTFRKAMKYRLEDLMSTMQVSDIPEAVGENAMQRSVVSVGTIGILMKPSLFVGHE